MSNFEVPSPILSSPFEEPKEHWWILEGNRRSGDDHFPDRGADGLSTGDRGAAGRTERRQEGGRIRGIRALRVQNGDRLGEKTTVMGMLAAWSILNKVNDRSDARFSDVVLVVAPNVTIRDRCGELDPEQGEASLYRTRDLVPGHLMQRLRQGKVIITNWHVFEPQSVTNGEAAKVVKRGREVLTTETIRIGEKNDTKRGARFLTRESLVWTERVG